MAAIAAFGALAAGYLARPLGGIVFGHFGDQRGRKSILVVSMSMMGVASFLIGLVPTYEAVGVAAPLILVTLRIVQGVALGGNGMSVQVIMGLAALPARRWGFSWQRSLVGGSPR